MCVDSGLPSTSIWTCPSLCPSAMWILILLVSSQCGALLVLSGLRTEPPDHMNTILDLIRWLQQLHARWVPGEAWPTWAPCPRLQAPSFCSHISAAFLPHRCWKCESGLSPPVFWGSWGHFIQFRWQPVVILLTSWGDSNSTLLPLTSPSLTFVLPLLITEKI